MFPLNIFFPLNSADVTWLLSIIWDGYAKMENQNTAGLYFRWSFESGGVVKNLVTTSSTPNIQFIPSSDSGEFYVINQVKGRIRGFRFLCIFTYTDDGLS